MRYCILVVLLLLVQLARGTLPDPAVVNYIQFLLPDETSVESSQIRIDDTTTSIFVLIIGEENMCMTLIIAQLDPQSGAILENTVVNITLGILGFRESVAIESPMPNKVAVLVSDVLCDSGVLANFTLYNSQGELEQTIYVEGYRGLHKPNQAPHSSLFNSLFLPSNCGFGVLVLHWNQSQYFTEEFSYLETTIQVIVGDYVYAVFQEQSNTLCKYALRDVLFGDVFPLACIAVEVNGNFSGLVASPSRNRLAWMINNNVGSIYIYDIPTFMQVGFVTILDCYYCILFEEVQFSEFGELIFGQFGDFDALGDRAYRYQDVSALPLTQAIYTTLYPSFLESSSQQDSGLTYCAINRGARFAYTNFHINDMFFIIAYDASPLLDPYVTSTTSTNNIAILEDWYRGVIWGIYTGENSSTIQALHVGNSFTSFEVVGEYLTDCVLRFQNWYLTNSSMYLVIADYSRTCLFDLRGWPDGGISLIGTFTTNATDVAQQIMWIDNEPVKISIIPTGYMDYYCYICLDSDCELISTPMEEQPVDSRDIAIATRGDSEFFVVSISDVESQIPSTSLFILPVIDKATLGPPIIMVLAHNCTFISSKLFGNSEIWFACEQEDARYVIYQFNTDMLSIGCVLPTHAYYPNNIDFMIRGDGKFLSVITPAETRVYDISGCHYVEQFPNYPILQSSFTPPDTYVQTILVDANNANLQVGLGATGLDIIVDCGLGMFPNKDHFCSKCPPGTSGILCQLCSGGFICENFGTTIPSKVCPPGYFCTSGTNSSHTDMIGGPALCPAGTYCPFGIASEEVNLAEINSPRWCPQGYYCPVGSSKPDNNSCSQFSSTKGVGGKSIDDCVCNAGYWGHAGQCYKCPEDCDCHEDVISGCYVDTSDNSMILCPPYNFNGTTACNPLRVGWNGTGDFPCAEGFSGRLCSKCLPNHYKQGKQCGVCYDDFKWKLPLAYSIVVFAAVTYVWFTKVSSSAVILILAFHFQTLYALITGGNQWNIFPTNFFYWASSASSFSVKAIECVFPWWDVDVRLIYYLSLPVLYIIFAVIAALISFALNKRSSQPRASPFYYKTKSAKMVVYLFNFTYFSVVMAIFSVLATENGYLDVYPYMKYNSTLATIAVIGLVVEGLIIPLIMAVTVWKHPREEGWVKGVFGSLYCVYVPSKYYWMLVVTARRVAIACIVTFSPYNSPILMIGIIAIVLFYMLIQMNIKPYVRTMDNIFESMSHFILVCTLSMSLVIEIPRMRKHAEVLVYTAVITNTVFLAVGVLYAIYSFKDGVLDNVKSSFALLATRYRARSQKKVVVRKTTTATVEERPLLSAVEPEPNDSAAEDLVENF